MYVMKVLVISNFLTQFFVLSGNNNHIPELYSKMNSKDLQVVDLNLEFSHICSVKDHIWNTEYIPKNFNEDTYDYEFQIKDVNDGDMKQYIEKIVINLHETVNEPTQIFTEPPYVIKRSGWAGFPILVEFYFKGLSENDSAKCAKITYDLFLTPNLEEIKSGRKNKFKRTNKFSNRKRMTISHKNPRFIQRLINGGGYLHKSQNEY